MSEDKVVGLDLMPDWFARYKSAMRDLNDQLLLGLVEPGKGRSLDQLEVFNQHRSFAEIESAQTMTWQEQLARKAARFLRSRLRMKIVVPPVPDSVTSELLAKAESFGLKLRYLPELDLTKELRRWTKPGNWFFDQVRGGKVKSVAELEPTRVRAGWYFVDLTPGVDYTDGTQVFPNDRLTPLITRLRQENKVGKYDKTPAGSRFSVTPPEWDTIVCPALGAEIGVATSQVRIERGAEFNAIGNLYDKNRGQFNMWEWFADHFEGSYRLCGGGSGYGGLASVRYDNAGGRYDSIVARPLVSF